MANKERSVLSLFPNNFVKILINYFSSLKAIDGVGKICLTPKDSM